MPQTKSDLLEIIENLDRRIVYYDKERERHQREVARLSRLFIQLYEDKSTLDLRYSWLEEAASNAVTACADHRNGEIETLADELGIEMNRN